MMDLQTLQRWRATCQAADESGRGFLLGRFKHAMARYVEDIEGLRAALHITQSVLSGSTVLHILDIQGLHTWVPHDLNIYAPVDTLRCMVRYLITTEGYQLQRIHDSTYQANGAAGYKRTSTLARNGRHGLCWPMTSLRRTSSQGQHSRSVICAPSPSYSTGRRSRKAFRRCSWRCCL
ncbi:hypothetical protein OH77DRAFT_1579609 [Trametes cingulata]|nr:hypothetical protein OH77DRAFT_1579609 [Trametes cingulata]